MAIEVVRGSSDKPAASQRLAATLAKRDKWSGCLFVGYPIIGTAEGQHRIDALWLSPERGIVVFDLIEGNETGDFGARQDDSANKLDARLRVHRELVDGRRLRVPIHTVSFGPAATLTSAEITDYVLCRTDDDLVAELDRLTWDHACDESFRQALSILENVSTIRRSKVRRNPKRQTSRGAKLARLEKSIATLDRDQNRAVIETVDGVQRIRGLAGSGKTIVLALKAAYLHAQHPHWRIAVTFHTRSLKDMYKCYIEDFHLEQANEPPDWDQVRVVNAWGSGRDPQPGIYHEYCDTAGVHSLDFGQASSRFGREDSFGGACRLALDAGRVEPLYDAILVDEAQDFPIEFLRLCFDFLKEPGRLVYAYDELQNLERDSLPSPEEIFGTNANGDPTVILDGDNQDIVLKKCYRNPGPVLTAAHALGFGVYRSPPEGKSTGLVQMFDNPELWEEVGYRVAQGKLRPGSRVTLERSNDTSPTFLSSHSAYEDLIAFKAFETDAQQTQWLVDEIKRNLTTDELRPTDLMVVHPEPLTAKKRLGPVRAMLFDVGIQPYLAGVDQHGDVFWPDENAVVFSTIHRAKGNEAAMVYVVDAQECHSGAFNLARRRNRLFAAMTRSKAWIRVVGVGPRMRELVTEYERVAKNGFALRFTYPTEVERKDMRIAHRDRTVAEAKRVASDNKHLLDLIANLRTGNTTLTDLDPDALSELREVLKDSS